MKEIAPSKKEQFNKELGKITDIFFGARENFNYCYYLHKPNTKIEAEYLDVDRDLKFIRHSLWRLSIIELAQLFSNRKNDKLNLNKFLSKLVTNGYYSGLAVDQNKIWEWQTLIINKDSLIKKIIALRDKIYAHTDPDNEQYREIEIYLKEIEELFEIVASVITELYSSVLKTTLLLRGPVFERNRFNMVKTLAEEHKKQVEDILKLITPNSDKI